MFRRTGNFRLALSIGLVVASIMWIANTLGWFPNHRNAEIERRLQLANSFAMPVSQHIQRQRLPELEALLNAIVARYSEFESAGWRTNTGRLLIDVGQHSQRFTLPADSPATSVPNHLSIDVQLGAERMGSLEFRLAPVAEQSSAHAYAVYPGPLIYGMAVCCTLFSWYVLHRAWRKGRIRQGSLACVHSAFDALSEASFMVDRHGRIALHNQAFAELTGRSDWVGKHPATSNWFEREGRNAMEVLPWQASLADGKIRRGLVVGLERDQGKLSLLRVNAIPVQVKDGKPEGVMVSLEDITIAELQRTEMIRVLGELRKSEVEIKEKNRELEFLATSDALTECLNRRSFYQTYNNLRVSHGMVPCSMILCDIDHFKRVNDQHGHGVGDLVLKKIGAILRALAPNKDHVFRLGGEEFCIFLPGIAVASAAEIAETIRESIGLQPIEGLSVTASFGIATLPQIDPSPDTLLEKADQALYRSKHNGRNRVTRSDEIDQPSTSDALQQSNRSAHDKQEAEVLEQVSQLNQVIGKLDFAMTEVTGASGAAKG